jgi:hypothetical protein
MQIEKVEEQGRLTLFKIHDGEDEEPYKLWSTDERHAIEQAKKIALVANLISYNLLNSMYGR